MDSHTPFIDAIRERPDDDAPRLVYADWLEENGEGERAELIRVQCRLARLPDPPRHVSCRRLRRTDGRLEPWLGPGSWWPTFTAHVNVDNEYIPRCGDVVDLEQTDDGQSLVVPDARIFDVRYHAYVNSPAVCEIDVQKTYPYPHRDELARLRKRERELIHETVFWGIDLPVPAHPDNGACVWRRGFVDSLTCTAADWLAHGDAILAEHPVRRVRLTTRPDPFQVGGLMADCGVTPESDPAGFFILGERSISDPRELLTDRWPGVAFELLPESHVTPTRLGDMHLRIENPNVYQRDDGAWVSEMDLVYGDHVQRLTHTEASTTIAPVR